MRSSSTILSDAEVAEAYVRFNKDWTIWEADGFSVVAYGKVLDTYPTLEEANADLRKAWARRLRLEEELRMARYQDAMDASYENDDSPLCR